MAVTKYRFAYIQAHPERKKEIKQQMNQRRRQLENKGLDEIKRVFNQTGEIPHDIDYYTDRSFLKNMSRKKADSAIIEKRCSDGRLNLLYCWV